jgi:myxalamid-type polyketide synthase MxaE and MxaD
LTRTGKTTAALSLDPNAAYVVTGGFGRLGVHIAEWLSKQGARHLVLVGRTAIADRAEWSSVPAGSRQHAAIAAIERLEACGVHVIPVSTDIADEQAADRVRSSVGSLTVRGIVHAAAVFEPCPLVALTDDAFRRVLRPKADGVSRLAALSQPGALDFLVLFSSTTALLGVKHLGAYAAANACLDSMAASLRADGHRAVSVNWGTWDEMADLSDELRESYVRAGLHPMRVDLALDGLNAALNGRSSQIVVADVDWNVLRSLYEARRRRPILQAVSAPRQAARSTEAAGDLASRLARAREGERHDIVLAAVRTEAAAVLGVTADQVDPQLGLFEMGMDSLMSVELRRRLEKLTHQPLPSTLTFNYPSVRALAGYLFEVLTPRAAQSMAAAGEAMSGDARLLDVVDADEATPSDLDDLSEDSLAALLMARLSRLER